MKTEGRRQSKNIEDRRDKKIKSKDVMKSKAAEGYKMWPAGTKFSRYIDGEFKKPVDTYRKPEFKKGEPTKPNSKQLHGENLAYYEKDEVAKMNVKKTNAGASNPATQKWKGK